MGTIAVIILPKPYATKEPSTSTSTVSKSDGPLSVNKHCGIRCVAKEDVPQLVSLHYV
jgi:hypothetical protein